MTARHLRIYGKVQGVFYRNWAEQTARSHGLSGWVRNCTDGSVEAVVAGEMEHIRRFIALAHKGPAAARVTHIDDRAEPDAEYVGFVVRPTQ
jgi:acylphosphatase